MSYACRLLLATWFVTSVGGAMVQDPDRPSPEVLLEQKLLSPFFDKADWILDHDRAIKLAQTRKRPILGYFTTAGY